MMPWLSPLLPYVEAFINKAFHEDPTSRRKILNLENQSALVQITDLKLTIGVSIEDGMIRLTSNPGGSNTTALSGSLADFLRAARTGHARGLAIQGDAELAQSLALVFSRLPQGVWEKLSRVVGDFPVRTLERSTKTSIAILNNTFARFRSSLGEYLEHESNLIVSRSQSEDFFDRISNLQTDTDRLAQRISRLKGSPQK